MSPFIIRGDPHNWNFQVDFFTEIHLNLLIGQYQNYTDYPGYRHHSKHYKCCRQTLGPEKCHKFMKLTNIKLNMVFSSFGTLRDRKKDGLQSICTLVIWVGDVN